MDVFGLDPLSDREFVPREFQHCAVELLRNFGSTFEERLLLSI
jgi:hypothetical protein